MQASSETGPSMIVTTTENIPGTRVVKTVVLAGVLGSWRIAWLWPAGALARVP